MRRRACTIALMLAVVVVGGTTSVTRRAWGVDTEPDARTAEESRKLFDEGAALYHAKRWSDALSILERSYTLAPSPNTGLLIARCLRELARGPDAVLVFQRTEEEARRRVAAGESKYRQAGDAAAQEERALRASLATILVHVHVTGGRHRGATLTIDGRPIELDDAGNAKALHDGGRATLIVRYQGEETQRQVVTVPRGAVLETEFAAPPSSAEPQRVREASPPKREREQQQPIEPEPAQPPQERRRRHGWALPATIAGGSLTVIGAVVYFGFNAAAWSTFNTLDARCGPSSCGDRDRAEADSGRTQQTIAVVGLVTAVVAAAATTATTVFLLSGRPTQ